MQALDWLVENNVQRNALKQRLSEFLEEEYFPKLRKLTGNQNLSTKEAFEYAEYIDWARKSGMEIAIGPDKASLSE